MHVIDLEGNEYPLQATIKNDGELNGSQSLSATIGANKVNNQFIDNIGEMWNIVDHDNVEHKILFAKKQGEGNRLAVSIKAIPLFFDVLKKQRIYDRIDKHMTAAEAFGLIFEDTGFDFSLVGSFLAVEWEGFGDGEEKSKTFERALNRYKAEFRISGNLVYLEPRVGSDTGIMYRYRLNASNIIEEIDANNMWTYARGYGDYEDEGADSGEGGWQNAKLIREYTSPLADIPGIGLRHAPPIKDGRITDTETMDEALKELVDESLKISVTADIHDLRKQGYPVAQSQLGDRVFLIDERIGLNDEARVVAQSVTRNWRGDVIDINITFGSEGITKRHQARIDEGIKRIDDILEGREPLPYNVLPEAVKRASEALKNAMTELKFPEHGGILAVDKNNPNLLVLFNSAGLGVSNDGGQTFPEAITGHGVNTSLLTAGDIHTNNIRIIGQDNYFYWDGNALTAIDRNNPNKRIDLTAGLLSIKRGAISIERPDGAKFIIDGVPNLNYNVQGSSPPFTSALVRVTNQWYITEATSDQNVDMFSFRHEGRYLKVNVAHRMETDGTASGAVSVKGLGSWANIIDSSTVFSNSVEDGSEYHTFTIDIGVPTYQRVDFYVQLRTGAANRRAMTRILRSWQEG